MCIRDRVSRSLGKMHKVLKLEEAQENAVEQTKSPDGEFAVSIKGNFSWKFGEKDKEEGEESDSDTEGCWARCFNKDKKKKEKEGEESSDDDSSDEETS